MGFLGLAALGTLNAINGGYGVNPYGGYGGFNNPYAGGGFGGFNTPYYGGGFNQFSGGFGQDPRAPFSPFTVTATLQDNQDFFLWGALNEFQASVFRSNPEIYPHIYDQYPHPGYLNTRPSWAGGLPGSGGGRLDMFG